MFLDLLFTHLRRQETVRSLLRSDRFRAEFTAKILELGVDERQVEAIAALLLPSFAAWAESRASETSAVVDELARRFNEAYPDAIRRAHIAALSETPNNDKRAEFYAKLRWFMFSTEAPILLGDSACLFELAGERRFKPIHDAEEQLQRVFLPISSKRLLWARPTTSHPKLNCGSSTGQSRDAVTNSSSPRIGCRRIPGWLPVSGLGQAAGVSLN
jgi:hypothetical protein